MTSPFPFLLVTSTRAHTRTPLQGNVFHVAIKVQSSALSCCLLGLQVNDKVKWNHHIMQICLLLEKLPPPLP